ncbi:MAG: PAS domain S-box protein [Elusimicrobiaceae bacterium]|nr:PAS domain S-box protein [Elusimicrobiaceae bacterium]
MKRLQTRNFRKLTERLKQARKTTGLSQADVARLMGVTQSYISKAEAGQVRVDIVQLRRFAGLYKQDLGYFVDGAEPVSGCKAVSAAGSGLAVFDEISRGALVFDEDGLVMQANPALEKMLGYTSAELAGKMAGELMAGDTSVRVMKLLRGSESANCSIPDAELLRKDDGVFLADLDVTSTFNAAGLCTGGVLFAVMAGVTERDREILRASSQLIDESFDAIILLQDGMIKYANKAASTMSGYAEKELLGMDFLTLVIPELRQELAHRHALRIKGAKLPATLETRIQLKNGKHLDVELVLGNLLYKGRPAYTVVARDIARRKMSEDEARYRLETATRENEEKERFVRELGKRLSDAGSILSGAHLASESVRAVSERLNGAVAEIALRSRRGKAGQTVADFSPHDIIAWAVKRIKHTSSTGKRLSIRIATAPDLPVTLFGRGRQAMAVTANIARNAAARTRDSAIEIRAEYLSGTGEAGGRLVFEITAFNDTTPASEIKATIETGQPHRHNPYLSLAVFMAHLHGFSVESEKNGNGDRLYRLTVPAEPGRAPAFVRKPRLPEAKSFVTGETAVFTQEVRIIAVHPDTGFMESFAPALAESGAQADFFQNASEAIAEILRGEFDIAVFNEDMQGLTAAEAAGFLRKALKNPPVIIVLDSGCETPVDETGLYDLKLAKPVSAGEIAAACLSAFTRRRSGTP